MTVTTAVRDLVTTWYTTIVVYYSLLQYAVYTALLQTVQLQLSAVL